MRKIKNVLYGIQIETHEVMRVTQSPQGILALDGGWEFRTGVRRRAWWAAAMFHLTEVIALPAENGRPDHPKLLEVKRKVV